MKKIPLHIGFTDDATPTGMEIVVNEEGMIVGLLNHVGTNLLAEAFYAGTRHEYEGGTEPLPAFAEFADNEDHPSQRVAWASVFGLLCYQSTEEA